ncbi:hypothetical protein KUW19_16415 [Ferrimonas balearica]|uniref:hypothetical protein n=1 Tax=Ferrimonas balearica TaxID=44012 RepID=UPI001C952186|nr:hypothetical protein [Ferrimonas balearica]MBY6108046.1 hypothetical protein [Ferrimonas balearica]
MLNKTASTQYNDWFGEAAFDNADINDLSAYARSEGHIKENEVIFGFDVSYNHLTGNTTVTIGYAAMSYDEFKSSNGSLSEKDFDLSPEEFFKLFKRTSFVLKKKGL